MSKQLNELHSYPKWIDTLTDSQRHEWYLRAKEFVIFSKKLGDDTTDLENAITAYESRNGFTS